MLGSRIATIGFFVGIITSAAFAGDAGKASAVAPLYPDAGRGRFVGNYCDGVGDIADLKLIDESFAFLHANPYLPNLTMLYQPDQDTLEEGAGWARGGFRTAMDSPMPPRRSSPSPGSLPCNARGTSSGRTKVTASAWAAGVSLPKICCMT